MTPPISPALAALLAQLPTEGLDFSRLLQALDVTRFTGTVTFDFRNGRPQQINLGQPVKLTICHGVDNDPPSRAG